MNISMGEESKDTCTCMLLYVVQYVAKKKSLRSYPNTSFSFAKVLEAKASWFHDY